MEIPSSLSCLKSLPSSTNKLEYGLRIRIICMHKRSHARAKVRDPHRYHWITIPENISKDLYLNSDQFRPSLHLL
ncbi:unnamed protein product [Dracunculus medinensis]|uniref:Ovule protein n=1 Tax=Dracunculus medinensis TaxID=318479 RepID=A0A0N4U5J7_DRAME|nr:unnamed protein product [Dracunculus medinensis]